jgi:nucleoside-diphosphate-sugar epimerase
VRARTIVDGEANRRVLVLGGAGYLGSVMVRQLLEAGRRVRVLDSFMFGEKALESVKSHPYLEVVRGDVRDVGVVVRCMCSCEAVVHLAGIVGDPACEENKELAVEVNRAATRMLANVARQCGVPRFIFASSCSVYGASDFFVNEESAVNPLSVYSETKIDSEQILLGAKSATFAPTILRFGTLFGLSPRMRFDLVANLFVARAVFMGSVTVINGDQWRPLLHVQDAARACVASLEAAAESVGGEVFNVGAPELNSQIGELGRVVSEVIPQVEVERLQTDDRRNYRVTFDKIRERLGFDCWKTLESGIREIYGAIHAGLITDFTTAQFNNQFALRALVRAGARQSAPLQKNDNGASERGLGHAAGL